MKKILYILVLLLCSCAKMNMDHTGPKDGEFVTLQFKVDIPEAEQMSSRVINENQITDLQMLIFDENGRFISRHQTTFTNNNFVVTVPQSSNKRIVHFIANYNWSSFSDTQSVTKDEGELVAPLYSSDLIFWQRMVLDNGINANVFTSQPISLIRNMSKFTLENSATSLTNVTFALFNKASIGSVAPFNSINKTFDPVITEPVNVTYTDVSAFGTTPIYAFERKNSTVTTNPTYVIIQGTYGGATCFYKIDIIDDSKNMYDIKRNVWFRIMVESVTMAGYSTLEAAKNSPASNNISASVLLQSYPTISDGSFVLSVDKTVASFTSNGQTLNANATYKTVAGVSQNNLITITLVQDNNYPVVNGNLSYDPVTGNITAAINNVPSDGSARIATIKIEAGYLSRTIRLMLHAPFNFTNISLTPSVMNNTSDYPATLKFTIPAEAQYLIPFDCYITTAYLTPNFGNVEVIYENGVYKYKWKVTSVGDQIINLKTNTDKASETIFIEADLYKRGEIAYSNINNSYRFSNVVITPSRVDFGINKAVTLKFTVPVPGTFKIYTSNLTPTIGSVVSGVYTYVATSAGEQTINFTTNKTSIAETITLKGTSFVDYTVPLRNKLVTISGTLRYGTTNPGSIINGGTVTISVGTKVVGNLVTASDGTYQTSVEVSVGDAITLTYVFNGITYAYTTTVTTTPMTITARLPKV